MVPVIFGRKLKISNSNELDTNCKVNCGGISIDFRSLGGILIYCVI